jgi:hypothetical protein
MNSKKMLMGLLLLTFSQPAYTQIARHHLGLDIGYFKAFSDDLKAESDSNSVTVFDVTNGGLAAINYRYSLSELIDLVVDSRAWVSSDDVLGIKTTLTNTFFGGGFRLNGKENTARPFIQTIIYIVKEEVKAEVFGIEVTAESESAVGLGFNGGIDIRASDLISIPLQLNFLLSEPADNISGLGFTAGINFNFAREKAD